MPVCSTAVCFRLTLLHACMRCRFSGLGNMGLWYGFVDAFVASACLLVEFELRDVFVLKTKCIAHAPIRVHTIRCKRKCRRQSRRAKLATRRCTESAL